MSEEPRPIANEEYGGFTGNNPDEPEETTKQSKT